MSGHQSSFGSSKGHTCSSDIMAIITGMTQFLDFYVTVCMLTISCYFFYLFIKGALRLMLVICAIVATVTVNAGMMGTRPVAAAGQPSAGSYYSYITTTTYTPPNYYTTYVT